MKNKLESLREQYVNAKTDKEIDHIDEQMQKLISSDPDSFSENMVELVRDSADRAASINIKEQLKEVLPAVSVAYIAKTYFGKTRQWLYQRMNGALVNGKPAKFTEEELRILENALHDIGNKFISLRVSS